MNEHIIATGTVTNAIKGRDALKKRGFYAEMQRMKSTDRKYGCGYAIAVRGNLSEIEQILKEANVKIIKVL
ncbi:MAG: DUF3343 domain-containing protein [Ruminococcaceae bacterium]|nr:DUF3343 domain-containing protein [Oscillospiraceae bacterium]